jgi:hypothetical protein
MTKSIPWGLWRTHLTAVGETVAAPRGVAPDDFKESEVDRLCR